MPPIRAVSTFVLTSREKSPEKVGGPRLDHLGVSVRNLALATWRATRASDPCLEDVRCVAALVVGLVLSGAGDVRARPADWTPTRAPFDRVVVARYQAILARDPHDRGLSMLARMYQRYRTLVALIAEYDAKLDATPDDWASLVVTARLLELDNQRARAVATYQRAWAAKPADLRTALRLGDALRANHQPEDARLVYEQLLPSADKPIQREALNALVNIARSTRDRIAHASYAKRLAELDPQDARLQLDRGDAMLAIDLVDAALDAYAAAERLYATDPSRRLDVIVRRGQALERRDRGAAEAEYRRASAEAPKGHYLRGELFGRVVELHRRAGTLGGLLAITLEDWPEAKRGSFEWYELSKLYEATGAREQSVAALARAVATSTEPRWHFELADRYWPAQEELAMPLVAKLVARSPRDVGVLSSAAERYAKWAKIGLAVATYDKIVQLDPAAEDRMIDLVESYFRQDRHEIGLAAARSVAGKLRTAANLGRLGTVLLEWGRYTEADSAFTAALKIKPDHIEHLRGRAAARDARGLRTVAIADAMRVLELSTDDKAARTARRQLVRIVVHVDAESGARAVIIDDWRDAFAANPPDLTAGMLLFDYFGMAPCEHWYARRSCDNEIIRIVDKLSKLTQLDPDDVIAVAVAYSAASRHDEAIALLRLLERIAPSRKADVEARIASITKGMHRYHSGNQLGFTDGWIQDPEDDLVKLRRLKRDAIHTKVRAGLRLGFGAGLRGGTDSALGAGLMASVKLRDNVSIVTRVDWSQRQGAATFESVGGAVGVGTSILTTRNTTLVLGVGERLERRWGDVMEGVGRIGLSTELTLDLVGRDTPLSAGVRLEQSLSDGARATALIFEVGVELRGVPSNRHAPRKLKP